MADDQDDFGSVWDKMSEAVEEQADAQPAEGEAVTIEVGPPLRVVVVVRAEAIPVAPWPQGWRVGAAGPVEGHVTLHFEHDLDDSPIAQLSAVTGLFGILKGSKLEVVWWASEFRGPLPGQERGALDLDQELSDLLGGAE